MAFTYVQRSGSFYDAAGQKLGTGYSGHGTGYNNPSEQNIRATGPIPQGNYTIGPAKKPVDHLGPIAMPLTPNPMNVMFGRSAFFIHGDNAQGNHSASDGCIIQNHDVRSVVDASDDADLVVVGEESERSTPTTVQSSA